MFYLPLLINDRRMHVMHLQPKENLQSTTIPSFIVVNRNDYSLVSIPSEKSQMICDNADNVDLSKVDFVLTKKDSEILPKKYENLPCYQLELKVGGAGECVVDDGVQHIYFDGHIGGNHATREELRITIASELKDSAYILLVKYIHTTQHKTSQEYYAAIRVLTVKDEDKEICSSALDFGSEASQIFFKGDRNNLIVKDAFCDMIGRNAVEREILKEKDYYQGRKNDVHPELFKSIYHIHRSPGNTQLGDLPMNNGTKTFVQTLLPVDYQNNGELVLLPNLKLIELLNFRNNTVGINFEQGVDKRIINTKESSLGVREIQDGILRLILSNFLSVILYNRRPNDTNHGRCLSFTLLVPNVYYQKKVSKLIDDLYEDFDLLLEKHADLFKGWRGMEVKVLSESDASYFGIRIHNNDEGDDKEDSYNLVIDAGKGTTDFSLLHQQGTCFSEFACVYRSGIPASGHVLTYAVYEALANFFVALGLGDKFKTILANAQVGNQTKEFIEFVELLEIQKIELDNFSNKGLEQFIQQAQKLEKFSDLNLMLNEMNEQKIGIPLLKDFIKNKINLLVNLMDCSIFSYATKHHIQLYKVFLTGRAFELKLFRDRVVDRLIELKLIENKKQVVFESVGAKNACVRGAVDGNTYIVNNKSIMLGTPSMVENVGEISIRRQKIRHLFRKDKIVMATIDHDFFYKGIKKGSVYNVKVDLGGHSYHANFRTKEDTYLYFLGDKYLIKHGNNNEIINETTDFESTSDARLSKSLAEESLFPFYINLKNIPVVCDELVNKLTKMMEQKSEQATRVDDKSKKDIVKNDTTSKTKNDTHVDD